MAHIPHTPSERKLQELLRIKQALDQDQAEQERTLETLRNTRQCQEHCVYPDVCSKGSCILRVLSRRVEEASFWDKVFSTKQLQMRRKEELQALWKIRKSSYYSLSHEPILQRLRHLKEGYEQWEKSSNDTFRVNPHPERQLMRQLSIGPARLSSPPQPPTGKK